MSELVVTALKVLFLALLWVFILFLGGVVRTDLFGRTVKEEDLPADEPRRRNKRRRRRRPRRVVLTSGASQGATFSLTEGDLLIGRSSDCQIILDDDYVSTRHARIGDSDDGWYVEDLGSTNGTHVNGSRVTTPTLIGLSDEVRIGRTTMKLEA